MFGQGYQRSSKMNMIEFDVKGFNKMFKDIEKKIYHHEQWPMEMHPTPKSNSTVCINHSSESAFISVLDDDIELTSYDDSEQHRTC